MFGDNLRLNERHGRVPAAEAQGADLQKAEKQLQVDHLAFLLWEITVRITPMTIQDRMTYTTLIRKT